MSAVEAATAATTSVLCNADESPIVRQTRNDVRSDNNCSYEKGLASPAYDSGAGLPISSDEEN